MTINYAALAERIELYASLGVEGCDRWRDDLRTVVTLLNEAAEARPAMWVQSNHLSWAGKQPFMARCAPTQLHPDFVPVYLRPAPQPQPTEARIVAVADVLLAWGAKVSDRRAARALAEDVLRAALAAKETK